MITPRIPIRINIEYQKPDFSVLLQETLESIDLPVGVKVVLEGDQVFVRSQERIMGNQIFAPVNEKVLQNIKSQIIDGIIKRYYSAI
jgi:hypothetical protein